MAVFGEASQVSFDIIIRKEYQFLLTGYGPIARIADLGGTSSRTCLSIWDIKEDTGSGVSTR